MRKVLRVATAALIALLLMGGGAVYFLKAPGFTPERWKAEAANTSSKNPRIYWVSQVEKLLRPGMSKDDIIALLGDPNSKRDNRYSYDLGVNPYGIDYEYFVIEFDSTGKLSRFFIERG